MPETKTVVTRGRRVGRTFDDAVKAARADGARQALKEAADYLACRGDCAHRAEDIRNLRIPGLVNDR